MDESDVVELLTGLLEGESLEDVCPDPDVDVGRIRVDSFRRVGLLTDNEGLVVRIGDTEYQVTVVRSR